MGPPTKGPPLCVLVVGLVPRGRPAALRGHLGLCGGVFRGRGRGGAGSMAAGSKPAPDVRTVVAGSDVAAHGPGPVRTAGVCCGRKVS